MPSRLGLNSWCDLKDEVYDPRQYLIFTDCGGTDRVKGMGGANFATDAKLMGKPHQILTCDKISANPRF